MKKILFNLIMVLISVHVSAQTINITQATGWLETAYIKWTPISGVDSYNVYYTGGGFTDKKIDTQLIRNYGSYFRADVLGLAAGNYTLKVVPVTANVEGTATVSSNVTVLPHDRNGFAHDSDVLPGAYNFDGTLKNNAVVIYVTQSTKNTVSLVVTGATTNPCIGLQTILDGFKKGRDSRPLAVRLIGNITNLNYMLGGDIVIENNNLATSSITFEGVGSDALANGWGLRVKNASNIEVRNLGFMLTDASEGDNVGLQQGNDHVWVHNCDMFYGGPGGDADQAKGDGALDCKKSTFVTFSYNHFWDSGKCNLLGLSENTTTGLYVTYHHNWYDHSDSRHPRVRFYSAHVYNNYFDGNSKYGSGSTKGSSLFLEGNFFRNCKYPMLTSMQGSDVFGGSQGTFSSEDGGTIKAFNNIMSGQQRFVAYDATNFPIEFDAYVATTRGELVSNLIKSKRGNNTYNNFDTNTSLYVNSLVIDEPTIGRDKTMQYSGRVSGGDISFAFNNPVDDPSYAVNSALMSLLTSYTTQLVAVQGETAPSVSPQTLVIPSNNDQIVATNMPIGNMVFTWGGTATDVTVTGLPASGITFVKNTTAKTVTVSGTPTAEVSFTITTIGTSGEPVSGSGSITISDEPQEPAGDQIHNFTESRLVSNFYTFASANINSTNGTATYDGLSLTARLKMESATSITYTSSAISTLTLVFDPSFAGRVKLNGQNYTAVAGVVVIPAVPAGLNSIAKGDTANLFYIKTEYVQNLGLPQYEDIQKVVLYPNPVTNQLNIATSATSILEKVSIYNLTGQVVKNSNTNLIDMSDLSSGMYLVKIHTNQGTIDRKIIKE